MLRRTGWQKLGQITAMGLAGALGFSTICILKGDAKFYRNILLPVLHRCFDGEMAHNCSVWAVKHGLVPTTKIKPFETSMTTQFCGIKIAHPVGLAAGFDKDAEAVEGLHKIGFSFVEIGSVTPQPQPGNPKKRLFRLVEDEAVINRYGFNSSGHDAVRERLIRLRESNPDSWSTFVIGVNLGKNKASPDATADYVDGVKKFADLADYLVINISSPNTPGLRSLQGRNELETLISAVLATRDKLSRDRMVPVLLKIAPDLNEEDLADIADVVMNNPDCRIDGFIISNTTVGRPESLKSSHKSETGGLSGKPLKNISDETIKAVYALTQGRIPIIGVGGVSSGEDAYQKILYGASCVQVYTALVYQGPPLVATVCAQLDSCLQKGGFKSVQDAVGAFHKK